MPSLAENADDHVAHSHPHIRRPATVCGSGAGGEPFVTQLYIKDEARNAGDFLLNRVPAGRRHLVVAEFIPVESDAAELQASFDMILDTRDGTPTV